MERIDLYLHVDFGAAAGPGASLPAQVTHIEQVVVALAKAVATLTTPDAAVTTALHEAATKLTTSAVALESAEAALTPLT